MSQDQPGDRAEADLRHARAIELAEYLTKHPGPAGTVRYRIENLAGCQKSEHELDLLVDLVEHILDLAAWQRRKGRAA
jgi:hypothetical protein